jgi:hypothetical protein
VLIKEIMQGKELCNARLADDVDILDGVDSLERWLLHKDWKEVKDMYAGEEEHIRQQEQPMYSKAAGCPSS